jgi:hypothetical protein
MNGIGAIVEAARARRDDIRRVAESEVAAHLSQALRARWLSLPHPAPAPLRDAVAVDGTGHAVGLATGAHLIVSMAIALGPAPVGRVELAEVEALPARFDDAAASSARDLVMRALETQAALESVRCAVAHGTAGHTTVWIDGSLFGDLAHMAGGPSVVRWGGGAERAGELLRATRDLHRIVEVADARIVGLAKTQRASILGPALAPVATGVDDSIAGTVPQVDHGDAGRPRDGELLAAMPEGWSWPLVLDARQFLAVDDGAASIAAECPAIVTTYIRPHPADLPLRLDVPAWSLGLPERIGRAPRHGETEPANWLADPTVMLPFVAEVMARYGGILAHNGPLHAVDHLVRLPRRDLETIVLPAIARAVGVPASSLTVDRGRRRFILE